jgi:proline dehydrogenase
MSDVGVIDRAVAAAIPLVPTRLVRTFAAPYIGGETLEQALSVVRRLNGAGLAASLDVLGEHVHDEAGVRAMVVAYRQALATLTAGSADSGVSVKPSALGAAIDWDLCYEAVVEVLDGAAASSAGGGRFVRLDMEESDTIDGTLALYRRLREEGRERVGIVLQARLWRTSADVKALSDLAPDVRLCKGIYLEPPSVGMQDREAIRHSFSTLLRQLLRGGSRVAIATHDEVLVTDALAAVDEYAVPAGGYELQMLLGVRGDLAQTLRRAGHRVRIYVPFGKDVFGYSVRRLRENPAVAGHVARALAADLAHSVRHGRRRAGGQSVR